MRFSAPTGGIRRGLDLVLDRGGLPVQQGGAVQVQPDQHGVVSAEAHALQGPFHRGAAALDVAVRQGGARAAGSRSPPAMPPR